MSVIPKEKRCLFEKAYANRKVSEKALAKHVSRSNSIAKESKINNDKYSTKVMLTCLTQKNHD